VVDLSVYVVTSAGLAPGRTHVDVALAAIAGGASAIQLRAPELDEHDLVEAGRSIARACRNAGITFIVNDRVDVALEVGADGVHLGQSDEPGGGRSRVGPGRLLGISVKDPAQARAAERSGADYLGVTVWPTATKPEARAGGLERLRVIASTTALSVVGIGGIDATNAAQVIGTGAAGVAVISAVGAADDPEAATRMLVAAVERARRRT
jgi:thiamine-phosphate pyrophosphorylase